MVSQASRHRGRLLLDAAVRTAEVIKGEEQRQRRFQVLPLLREGIRQARESPHLHSDSEVLTLNYRGTDSARVGVAKDDFRFCIHHNGWRVAAFVAFGSRIDFDELREVNVFMLKLTNERIAILREAISGHLKAIVISRGRELLGKLERVLAGAPSKMPC